MVKPSIYPIYTAFCVFAMLFSAVAYMHRFSSYAVFFFLFSFVLLLDAMGNWWYQVVLEGTYEGRHTKPVQANLKFGFSLFIVSEVMFFVSFFWAFFYLSLNPGIAIGGVWPPLGIPSVEAIWVPLANTCLLLSSSLVLNVTNYAILLGAFRSAVLSLWAVLALAFAFTGWQLYEYATLPFSINDSAYGSTFFMITGLHGSHVIVGTIFLAVCLVRLYFGHFTKTHHVGLECAVWYWHFVDIVWIFVFLFLYTLNSNAFLIDHFNSLIS